MAENKNNTIFQSKSEVKFDAEMSKSSYCVCDSCFNTERVMKLYLPHTKFHDGEIETKYREYWLCCSCYRKLEATILNCKNEDEVSE